MFQFYLIKVKILGTLCQSLCFTFHSKNLINIFKVIMVIKNYRPQKGLIFFFLLNQCYYIIHVFIRDKRQMLSIHSPGLDIWRNHTHFEPATRMATSTQTGTPRWSLPWELGPKPSETSDTKTCCKKYTPSLTFSNLRNKNTCFLVQVWSSKSVSGWNKSMTSVYKMFNYILLKCLLYGYYHNDTSNISTFMEMEFKYWR